MVKIYSVSFKRHRESENLGVEKSASRILRKVATDIRECLQTPYQIDISRSRDDFRVPKSLQVPSNEPILIP